MAAAPVIRDPAHQEFVCSICMEFLEVPVKTRCNHLFCKTCLVQALQVTESCPACRTPLTAAQFTPAHQMEQKMRNKFIRCTRCKASFHPIDGREHDASCVDTFVPPRRTPKPSGLGLEPTWLVFPCAYCGEKNFSREGLLGHCNTVHKNAPSHKLVCSICTAYPWGDRNMVSGNLLDHLNRRHQFDYDRFVNLQEDEELSFDTALQTSMVQPGVFPSL